MGTASLSSDSGGKQDCHPDRNRVPYLGILMVGCDPRSDQSKGRWEPILWPTSISQNQFQYLIQGANVLGADLLDRLA